MEILNGIGTELQIIHGRYEETSRRAVCNWPDERKASNMKLLESIVQTILLCSRQNIPLRGHKDSSKT